MGAAATAAAAAAVASYSAHDPGRSLDRDLFARLNADRGPAADRFFRGVTKDSLCGFVPVDDDAVEVLRDNGILRRFNYGSEAALCLLGLLALANVAVRFKN